MTKGQFALLTAALGLVTMGGAGYFAYASSSPSSSNASGPSGNGRQSGGGGAVTVPTGGASATSTPGSGGGADCQNGQVQVSQQQGQGAMGTVSVVLVFQNTSTTTCELRGYPGAALAAPDGTILANATRKLPSGLAKSPVVMLAPGAQATAVLSWSDVPNASGCAVQNAAKLLVTPPNTKVTSTLAFSAGTQVCSDFTIHPVLK